MAWYDALLIPLTKILSCRKLSKHYEDADKTARVKDQQPSPLPSRRTNLTRELLVDQAHHAQSSNSISTPKASSSGGTFTPSPAPVSPLLRLPFELRSNIYELALGGNFLNVRQKDCKIGHIRQSIPCHTFDLPPRFFHGYEGQHLLYPKQFPTTGLPLLLTCHSIYREAINSLYSSNTFLISDLSVLIYWADLPLLRPQRSAEIRHLYVRWVYYSDPEHFCGSAAAPHDWRTWSRFWDIVATRMPGLKKLELWMEYMGRREEVLEENEWVKAMLGVRRIKEVTVQIVLRMSPWAADRCDEVERVVREACLQD